MMKSGRLLRSIKLISGSKYLLFYSLAERFFFFVFFLIIARRFSVESYGELITAFAVANAAAVMFDLGIPIHLQKEIASGKKSDGLLPAAFSLSLMILPLFMLISVLFGALTFGIEISLMIFICLPVFLFSVSNLLNKALAGFGDFRSQFIAIIWSRTPLLIPLAVFYVLGQTSPRPYLLVILAGAVIQCSMLFVRLRRSAGGFGNFFSGFVHIRDLYQVLPLGAAVAFNFFYDKVDIILISKMLGFTESGIYNIAYGLFKAASLSYTFILMPALTKISYLSRRKSAVRLYLAKHTFIIFLICISIIAFFLIASDFLVRILYGDKFGESASVLKMLSVAALGLGINNLFGVALNGLGLYKENLYVTLTGLAVNISVNIILIPVMGLMGAVIATIATEYIVLAADSYYINKFLRRT